MKTCPICQAVAFDDALICYGCMHRYEEADDDQEELFGASSRIGVERELEGTQEGPAPENPMPKVAEGQGGRIREADTANADVEKPVVDELGDERFELGQLDEERYAEKWPATEQIVGDVADEHRLSTQQDPVAFALSDAVPGFVIKMMPSHDAAGGLSWQFSVKMEEVEG